MKFMLMIMAPRGTGDYVVKESGDYDVWDWKPEDGKAHQGHMSRLTADLKKAGQLVAVDGLAPPAQGRRVRADTAGSPIISDGPFAEAKEFLVGYWIVDVETPEEAYAIAARASAAPGPGGKPLNLSIEVRQVMAGPRTES